MHRKGYKRRPLGKKKDLRNAVKADFGFISLFEFFAMRMHYMLFI